MLQPNQLFIMNESERPSQHFLARRVSDNKALYINSHVRLDNPQPLDFTESTASLADFGFTLDSDGVYRHVHESIVKYPLQEGETEPRLRNWQGDLEFSYENILNDEI